MLQPLSHGSSRMRSTPTIAKFSSSLLIAALCAACATAPPDPAPAESPSAVEPAPVQDTAPTVAPNITAPSTDPAPATEASTDTTSEAQTPPTCVQAPAPKPKPKPHKKLVAEEKPSSLPETAPKVAELPAPPGSALANVRSLPAGSVLAVLGKKVWGPDGDDFGRVIDVLVDQDSGAIRSAVIDFGGFLGVGNRSIAVDWSLLQFKPGRGEKQVVLNLKRSQVLAAPEYRESSDHPSEVVAPVASGTH